MYDTEESTPRRIVALLLWLIVIVAVVWAVVWLVFLRDQPAKNTGTLKHSPPKSTSQKTTPSKPSSPPKTSSGGESNASSAGDNAGKSLASGSASTTTDSNLPNTGAGDIFVPFAVATAAGIVFYHVRLRKKLSE